MRGAAGFSSASMGSRSGRIGKRSSATAAFIAGPRGCPWIRSIPCIPRSLNFPRSPVRLRVGSPNTSCDNWWRFPWGLSARLSTARFGSTRASGLPARKMCGMAWSRPWRISCGCLPLPSPPASPRSLTLFRVTFFLLVIVIRPVSLFTHSRCPPACLLVLERFAAPLLLWFFLPREYYYKA